MNESIRQPSLSQNVTSTKLVSYYVHRPFKWINLWNSEKLTIIIKERIITQKN